MVTLKPLSPDEFELVARWLSDRDVNRWLTSEWRGREVTGALIAVAVRNKKNRLFLVQCDAHPCGLVGLADIDEADRTGMIWYLRGEGSYSGKGVISQAVEQAIQWAFAELGLASVYAWIMADNAPSRRVLETNGFREAGRLRMAARSGDCQVDRVYFDIVNPAGT
jgi:RimJ/RimL family protein N-acetyltransferase